MMLYVGTKTSPERGTSVGEYDAYGHQSLHTDIKTSPQWGTIVGDGRLSIDDLSS